MRLAVVLLVCAIAPASVSAQPISIQLPRNDASVTIGWAGGEYELSRYDNWRGSFLVAAGGGHYWTDHVKTELDVSWTNTGQRQVYEDLQFLGGVTYATAIHRARDIRVGAAQIFQFGRNAWAHPYIGIGVDSIWRSTTIDRDVQSRTIFVPPNRNVPVVLPPLHERKTDVLGQPILKTGVKLYASEKAFFSTELNLGIRHNVDHVVWKIGAGIDF